MKLAKKLFIGVVLVSGLTAFVITDSFAAKVPKCPQDRSKVGQVKGSGDAFETAKNAKTSADDIAAGKALFQKSAKPMACKMCHGAKGDGTGVAGYALGARNFTCAETMKAVTGNQMAYTIKYGSGGKGGKGKMMPFGKSLSDDQVWQLVSYIRSTFMK